LRERGLEVVHTREPGGTPLGDQVRQLVLLQPELKSVPRAEALLMCTARAQLVDEVIRPALKAGSVVICDRFADSTLAYQGYGRGLDIDQLASVISFATGGLAPDVTILLDVPVAEGLARKGAQFDRNRFEDETLEFHERIRDGYLALAATEPARWVRVDALLAPEVVADQVYAGVAPRLGLT
jgi:dTMP kinase